AMLFKFALEPAEQRKAVCCRAGKSREHAIVIQPPDFSRLVLDDCLTECDLTVAGENDPALVAYPQDGRRVRFHHSSIGARRGERPASPVRHLSAAGTSPPFRVERLNLRGSPVICGDGVLAVDLQRIITVMVRPF